VSVYILLGLHVDLRATAGLITLCGDYLVVMLAEIHAYEFQSQRSSRRQITGTYRNGTRR